MFILRSVRKSNWVGTGFQKHDKQDRGQKKIIHFHIVSESFPRKTLQISVEKEGLPLIYINKAQTKSPTHHRRILYVDDGLVDASVGSDSLPLPRVHDTFCPLTQAWRVTFSCPNHTIQWQAWHCPKSAQIGLVITNHVREFCHSFG